MVDSDRVRQLLEALTGYRAQLQELAGLPPERYAGHEALAGRYLVQASAQVCIDLANHLIASSGWRVPQDYADAFSVLEEQQILEPALALRLRELARLRNLLVHAYGVVDDTIIYDSLRAGLGDLDSFGQAVARLLTEDRPDE